MLVVFSATICSKKTYTLSVSKGIEQFFEENTHGILTASNLTLAIWEEEEEHSDNLIYMFDPNPRGPTGMPLETGTACVMTFVNAKVTADHIMACLLDPDQKMEEFAIVPVEIVVGDARTRRKAKKTGTSEVGVLPRCSKLVADEEKKILRKIVSSPSLTSPIMNRSCWLILDQYNAFVWLISLLSYRKICQLSFTYPILAIS